MGIHNQGSHPGVLPAGRGQKEQEEVRVSMLVNSIYYFLEFAFILDHGDHFRLVVLHRRRLLVHDSYQTARGARIAFSKIFRNKAWRKETRAEWSHFYSPEALWLKDKMEAVKE